MRQWRVLSALAALTVICAATVAFPWPRPGPASALGGLQEIDDALSGLPNNAAWQGVANDGEYWYAITSQDTGTPVDFGDNAVNIIRKYRISDGVLVQTKGSFGDDAYDEDRAFSSGEVYNGHLYIAARDRSVGDPFAAIVEYDLDLNLIEEHVLSDGTDGGAFDGYSLAEGVSYHDGFWWVMFGGNGSAERANAKKCAIGKYTTLEPAGEVAIYDLFTNSTGEYGGQNIWWADDEVLSNNHDGHADPEFQRWRWTGNGFTLHARYEQPDDNAFYKLGQGFTWLDGHVYFAARITDRIVQAALGTPKPTSTPTPTKQPPPGDTDGDGCTDQQENGLDETQGGLRDYLNPWDFFDPTGPEGVPDQYIDLFNDILGVIGRYTTGGGTYDPAFDRGPSTGPNAWNRSGPDGTIDMLNDMLGVIYQYQHDCRAA